MSINGNDYEPWDSDSAFADAYNAVSQNTLIDKPRLWELWCLIGQLQHENGCMIEVGVYRGGSLALMALAIQHWHSKSLLIGFDTFQGCVNAGQNDPVYRGGEHACARSEVDALLDGLTLSTRPQIIGGIFPESAPQDIAKIALAHIDVDTYESTKRAFEWMESRLILGSVLVVDDYGFMPCAGVMRCINERIGDPKFRIVHNLNTHAILVKVL